MDTLEELQARIDALDAEIADWEPDPGRTDWPSQKSLARDLAVSLGEILSLAERAVEELGEPEVAELLDRRCAYLAEEVACYLFLAGDPRGAEALLGRAAKLSPDEKHRAQIAAGMRDPERRIALVYGRWLVAAERFDDARRVVEPLTRGGKGDPLAEAARELIDMPRPISSAPNLWRVNGFGQALYGNRDEKPDGTYVATLCVSLLFFPVFPRRAYRVRRETNGWSFLGEVPLSPFAKAARLLAPLLVVLAIGSGALAFHYASDDYAVSVAMEEARALESSDRDAAIERYRAVIDEYAEVTDVDQAVESVVRLAAESVPDPCTSDDVDRVSRVVNTVYQLPDTVRDVANEALVPRLLICADQIGDTDVDRARATVAVLDMVAELSPSKADTRAKAIETLGDRLAPDRPLVALWHYMSLGYLDDSVLTKAQIIIDTFGPAPSLWMAAEGDVDKWILAARAKNPPLSNQADGVATRLDEARQRASLDVELVEGGDHEAIAAALARQKDNQELAIAVASHQRDEGELDAAIATLEAAAPAGRMVGPALHLLALLHRDKGQLAAADALLTPFVRDRMGAFQAAQRRYWAGIDEVQRRVIAELERGSVPTSLETKLAGASDEEQGALIRGYVMERMTSDPKLTQLRDEFLQHESVVPLSMTLGAIKLARANAKSGTEREALLKEAEGAFLAIRGAGEGQPSYHLGLGEIYHRLGKTQEGDAELEALLERNEPTLTLETAAVYRGLGKTARAREILEALFESPAPLENRQSAAYMLSLLATTVSETEKWLGHCDSSRLEVKVGLVEVRARRAYEEGHIAAADAAYAEAATLWRQEGSHSPVALNNEAVAHMARYATTGRAEHLRDAVSRFEESMKLHPDAPVTVQNVMETLELVGLLKVLEPHFRTEVLAPTKDDAEELLDLILESDEETSVRAALRPQPELSRAVELGRQLQVLAPHRTNGFAMERDWLDWLKDVDGLNGLADRLERGDPLDITDIATARRKWERGELGEEERRGFTTGAERAARRLERAESSGHPPTLAAALVMSANMAFSRFSVLQEGEVTDAIALYRRAYESWPHLGTRRQLLWALISGAVAEARDDAPVLAEAYAQNGKVFDFITVAQLAIEGPNGEQAREAIAREPFLKEALDVARGHLTDEGDYAVYLAARWAKDTEVEKEAGAVFDAGSSRAWRRVDALLYPGERSEATRLELFDRLEKSR